MASRSIKAACSALLCSSCSLTFVDEAGFQSTQLPAEALVVDAHSVGGACDDAFTAEQARSYTTPWCTVGRALAAAPRGSTVHVRKGLYPLVEFRAAVGRSAELLVTPYPLEQVQIAGMTLEAQQYLTFQGFHFTEPVQLFGANAHLRITDCDITSSKPASGVLVLEPITDFSLERCHVHDLEGGSAMTGRGVSLNQGGDHIQLLHNTFSRLESDGVWMAGGSHARFEANTLNEVYAPFYLNDSTDVVVSGNQVHQAKAPAWLHGIQRLEVSSNLFTGFPFWAISLGNVQNARFLQNTVWGNGKGGIDFTDGSGAPSTGTVLQNNVLQSVEGGSANAASFLFEDYNLIASGYRRGAHDVSLPPLFVDPSAFDFHLAEMSPGIDAALADGAPTTDAQGQPREDDPAVSNTGAGVPPYGDLGAFEGR